MSLTRTLLLMGGSYFVPRVFRFVNSLRSRRPQPSTSSQANQHRHNDRAVRPCPRETGRSLNILFFSALIFFLFTFPQLTPTNVFIEAGSDIRTSTTKLFNNLALIRPVTRFDDQVRQAFQISREARILYAVYGPNVLTECTVCGGNLALGDSGSGNEGITSPTYDGLGALNWFYIYALPRLVMPHAVHLLFIGLGTSQTIGGYAAGSWRRIGVYVGLLFAAAELCFMATVVPRNMVNMEWVPGQVSTLSDTYFLFWTSRMIRFLTFAVFDSCLAGMIWLWATNRWPGQTPDPVMQLVEAEGLMRMSIMSIQHSQQTATMFGGDARTGGSSTSAGDKMKEGERAAMWQELDPSVLEGELGLSLVRKEAEGLADAILKKVYLDRVDLQKPVSGGGGGGSARKESGYMMDTRRRKGVRIAEGSDDPVVVVDL